MTEIVQCVCGKSKQRGFICDFCFSTQDTSTRKPMQVRPKQRGRSKRRKL